MACVFQSACVSLTGFQASQWFVVQLQGIAGAVPCCCAGSLVLFWLYAAGGAAVHAETSSACLLDRFSCKQFVGSWSSNNSYQGTVVRVV
jgi:hypothetical protein